ncbi:MAG: hypothetical protein QG673_835 [Pseudomonadota bacterium]|nr:hypothetical protein [Pseudomonadota bacterium]
MLHCQIIKKYTNKISFVVFTIACLIFAKNIFAIDCTNPCGAEELITCAAQSRGISAEDLFNTVLFSTANLDGMCNNQFPGGTSAQKYFYNAYCPSQKGSYFSYQNFIAATKSSPLFAEFGCAPGTSKASRYQELANFLATVSQETTSVASGYTNDGLYWRYEAGWLQGNDPTNGPDGLDYITPYFYSNVNSFWVAATSTIDYSNDQAIASNQDTLETWTGNYWQGNPTGSGGNDNQYSMQDPDQMLITTYTPPVSLDSSTPVSTNLGSIIRKQFWVGMGPKQLTGDSMMGFFGWYLLNLQENQSRQSNFYSFVNQYLTDGKLAFQGALWYWMKRINVSGAKPIHAIVTNPNNPVCQAIAIATVLVNGRCNNFDPGRLTYYTYYMNKFGLKVEPYTMTDPNTGLTLDSLECSNANVPQYTALLNYCISNS